MKYIGSKSRLSKELVPIIQSYINESIEWYIEPFVGGANMIDKIKFDKKIGCDSHKELIALLKYLQSDKELPYMITEDEYMLVKNNKSDYPDWYVGLVGFCSTFGSKYFGGYARSFKNDGVTPRNMSNEAIRNIEKQRKNLQGIYFKNIDFVDIKLDKINNCVIYCDPPYRNTTKYSTEDFPYDYFYDWCRQLSKNNTILISEYTMPKDFECVWRKDHKTELDIIDHKPRTEKLFTIKR